MNIIDGLTIVGYSLNLERDPTVNRGEIAILVSPIEIFSYNKIVTMNIKKLKHNVGNAISVWLHGSYGLSQVPIIDFTYGSESNHWTSFQTECRELSDDWGQCSFCIPGGSNVTQRLVLTGLYETDDTFSIDDVKVTEKECDHKLTIPSGTANNFKLCSVKMVSYH